MSLTCSNTHPPHTYTYSVWNVACRKTGACAVTNIDANYSYSLTPMAVCRCCRGMRVKLCRVCIQPVFFYFQTKYSHTSPSLQRSCAPSLMNSSSLVHNAVVVNSGRNSFTASRTSCYVLQPVNAVWGWGVGSFFNKFSWSTTNCCSPDGVRQRDKEESLAREKVVQSLKSLQSETTITNDLSTVRLLQKNLTSLPACGRCLQHPSREHRVQSSPGPNTEDVCDDSHTHTSTSRLSPLTIWNKIHQNATYQVVDVAIGGKMH